MHGINAAFSCSTYCSTRSASDYQSEKATILVGLFACYKLTRKIRMLVEKTESVCFCTTFSAVIAFRINTLNVKGYITSDLTNWELLSDTITWNRQLEISLISLLLVQVCVFTSKVDLMGNNFRIRRFLEQEK